MLLFVSALLLQQAPAFTVENRARLSRDEVVRVSIPLPKGRYKKFAGLEVLGRWAPAVPLVRWSDGSLAVVQLQPRIAIPAGSRRRIVLDPKAVKAVAPVVDGEPPSWYLEGALPLRLELMDPWGESYQARLLPDVDAGEGGWLRQSTQIRVRRYRSVFHAATKKYFGVIAYLTTFANERRAELTLLVENGIRNDGVVLGPARFKSLALVIEDPMLKTRPRFIVENGLLAPSAGEVSKASVRRSWRQVLLADSDQWYLGDRTAKAWRFDLFVDGLEVKESQRTAARLAADAPLVALPDVEWTRSTRAFGAHGGIANGPGRPTLESQNMVRQWRANSEFGPFGGFGDFSDAASNGTPRNGPSALHNVVRFGSADLLRCAEGMVLQNCLRPTPGLSVRIPEITAPLRQGLSERTMRIPHGFTGLDYEHFSVDLLYDYYWLTGDLLARDELRRIGSGIQAVLTAIPFPTCRGEGWCMQAAVLIARATGDETLVRYLDKRFREQIEPALGGEGASYVLRQPPHPAAFDGRTPFDCPWQMAALIHGAAAMFEQTTLLSYRDLVVRSARVMAGPGWARGQGPKYMVAVKTASEYMMPIGFGPLEGTALMELGGFVLAESLATANADKVLFGTRAAEIFAPYQKVPNQRNAMNPWFQLFLDQKERSR
jgi:hypothetical protein